MLDNLLSEVDVQHLCTLLDKAHNIIVTCHVSPDGDAMGAVLAFSHFLWRKGKNAQPVVPNIFPDFLKWMPGVERVRIYEKHENEVAPLVAAADLIICLDFNSPDRLQLYRILVQLEGLDPMTYEEAVCLYTGMMTDTGCFSYNSNRSDIYYIIGRLLTKGIDKDKIYRNVFFNYSAERFRLMGYMLYVKLEYFPEYHASLMTLTREEQKRFSHKKGDTEGFVNIPLQIGKSRLSVFLREDTERHNIRVSLRSVDDFPCNRMAAEFFNGGGHLNASGGELSCTMDEAVQIVRKALKKYASLLTDR